MVTSANLGFPRIGKDRELKFALEKYWRGDISIKDLLDTASSIREANWRFQHQTGIKTIPAGDFSFYDHVLDHSFMFGAIPPRFQELDFAQPEDLYFSMARGYQEAGSQPIPAMEMTKWFNTNYHYIVPEIDAHTAFSLHPHILLHEIEQAASIDIQVRPVILGPVSYLLLAKSPQKSFDPLSRIEDLLPIYAQLFSQLQAAGISWVQLDEPFLSADLTPASQAAYSKMFDALGALIARPNVLLTAYFADLNLNHNLVQRSPFEGLHVDLTHTSEPEAFCERLGKIELLSLGILNGRNIWREDILQAITLVQSIASRSQAQNIQLSPSCSLLHLPYDVQREDEIDSEVRSWMAFAQQKLQILAALETAFNAGETDSDFIRENQAIIASRRASNFVNADLQLPALSEIDPGQINRHSAYPERRKQQDAALHLPLFPTTTIGSFPQTPAVRKARADANKGTLSPADYETFLKEEIKRTVDFQEQIGIDMLVHGEFERNDMVQYFGEKLSGFAFSKYGWVQSYGSRYVRPPIIFGDVSRPQAMTVAWTSYAQSLTKKPMKGMLTGPVTIMLWSFIRDDQPLAETCKQIAYAIRQEVTDLEAAGTKAIQIDEPALREGLPIQRKGWDDYLDWSVKCFRIAASGVQDKTQIHTHMCYAEFNDIIDAIIALDADVISVEASRSKMELLDAFKEKAYPNEIGPGVYDIHSPTIPTQQEIEDLLQKALTVIPKERLWVNPDCGLKTRRWDEVKPALQNMVSAAKALRK
jgi:5-methyltetrahydropteroyltriglutamate--homocysteine methyltransferase